MRKVQGCDNCTALTDWQAHVYWESRISGSKTWDRATNTREQQQPSPKGWQSLEDHRVPAILRPTRTYEFLVMCEINDGVELSREFELYGFGRNNIGFGRDKRNLVMGLEKYNLQSGLPQDEPGYTRTRRTYSF